MFKRDLEGLYWDYTGIMENKMELLFRVQG